MITLRYIAFPTSLHSIYHERNIFSHEWWYKASVEVVVHKNIPPQSIYSNRNVQLSHWKRQTPCTSQQCSIQYLLQKNRTSWHHHRVIPVNVNVIGSLIIINHHSITISIIIFKKLLLFQNELSTIVFSFLLALYFKGRSSLLSGWWNDTKPQ